MNKIVSVLILILIIGFSVKMKGQGEFEAGTNVAQITFGYPQVLRYGQDHKTTMPVIKLVYDRGVLDGWLNGEATLGIGGFIGVAATKTEFVSIGLPHGRNYTFLLLGFRGTAHYELIDGFDLYGGALFGGALVSSTYYGASQFETDGLERGTLLAGFFVGSRYYFTDEFAAALEVGFGVAVVNIGASYRF